MTLLIARLLISVALLCAPFALLMVGSRRSDGLMWLLVPFFGGIPALLGALLVFAPLESALDARGLGHLKNAAVPLSGALLIVVFVLVTSVMSGDLSRMLARLSRGGINAIRPILFWSGLGVIWGALWRVSDWIAAKVGLAGSA